MDSPHSRPAEAKSKRRYRVTKASQDMGISTSGGRRGATPEAPKSASAARRRNTAEAPEWHAPKTSPRHSTSGTRRSITAEALKTVAAVRGEGPPEQRSTTREAPDSQSPTTSLPVSTYAAERIITPEASRLVSIVRSRYTAEASRLQEQVIAFDPLGAYERLRAVKASTREKYSDLNIRHSDALMLQQETKERLAEAREKKKKKKKGKWVLKRAAGRHWDGPDVQLERDFATEEFEDEALLRHEMLDNVDEYGDTWDAPFTGDNARDRGEEPGQGGDTDEEETTTRLTEYDPNVPALSTYHEGQWNHEEKTDLEDEQESMRAQWEWRSGSDVSSASTPDSLFDENVMEAKESHHNARKESHALREEMRNVRTEELRYERMIDFLQKQHPELRAYVALAVPKHRPDAAAEDHTFQPPRRKTHPVPRSYRDAVDQWHVNVQLLLRDHSRLESFPDPPSWTCEEHDICHVDHNHRENLEDSTAPRLLKACEHNIRDACAGFSKRQLKRYMVAWHPDRFSACQMVQDQTKALWMLMANEVFVAVSALWLEREGGEAVE